MTVDFLRARLLSERSVSRAAKERADELAKRVRHARRRAVARSGIDVDGTGDSALIIRVRCCVQVAELEEQVRAVTAQRRQAERAADEVLAILDSQGFGRLSDAADDSGTEDEVDAGDPDAAEGDRGGGNAAEDALSGSELGAQTAAAQAGGLSWKGRAAASHDCERRRPTQQQKGRQLRQRHGHGHRRGYLYSRAADPSPKYHPGQSCRKIKRKELRSKRCALLEF